MLHFNEYGFLPEGIHAINQSDFEKLFGFNPKRQEMIKKGLFPFLDELKRYKIKEIYLDGSFVTQEENPDDIDGYVLAPSESGLFFFIMENHERWQEACRMEIYAAVTDYEDEGSQTWWEDWFAKVVKDPNRRKGFVLLKLS